MWSAAVALLLAAGPTPASRAAELASSKSWDDLYLAFSSGDPKAYGPADRAKISEALEAGCEDLEKTDAVMAFTLADRATAFHPLDLALLCLARAGAATDQRGAAEEALRQGLKRYPKSGIFGLELGKLLLSEGDNAGAAAALERVPKRAPEFARARALLAVARRDAAAERTAEVEAKAAERQMSGAGGTSPRGRAAGGAQAGPSASGSLTYESGESAGMRTRGNSRFLLKYFNHDRDFGQRADYETRVTSALDEAYEASRRILGQARAAPLDVVLYTREEFAAHIGTQAAQRVAGLYSMDAIRMNDAEEITAGARATLVHEYVHAVLDDVCGHQAEQLPLWLNEGTAEWVEWRYQGHEGPPLGTRIRLRGMAKAGRLPSLRTMDRVPPIRGGDPEAAYATSAMAVKLLVSEGGTEKLLALMREVSAGKPFEEALSGSYGRSLDKLEGDLREMLLRN